MATFYIFFAQAISAVLKLSLVFQEKIERCNKQLEKMLKEVRENEKIEEGERKKAAILARKAKNNLKYLGWTTHGFCYSMIGLLGTLTIPEIPIVENETQIKNISIIICVALLVAIGILLLPYHLNKHKLICCYKRSREAIETE